MHCKIFFTRKFANNYLLLALTPCVISLGHMQFKFIEAGLVLLFKRQLIVKHISTIKVSKAAN